MSGVLGLKAGDRLHIMQYLSRLRTYGLPLAIFCGVLVLGNAIGSILDQSPAQQERQERRERARHRADQLAAELQRARAALETLMAIAQVTPSPPDASDRLRALLRQQYPAVQAARWQLPGRPIQLLALEAAAARHLAAQPFAAATADVSPDFRLQPLELPDGTTALLAQQCLAPTEPTELRPGCWQVLLSLSEVLTASQIVLSPDSDDRYEVRLGEQVVARTNAPLAEPVAVQTTVAGQTWTLAIAPADGWQDRLPVPLAQLLLILASALLALLVFFLLQQPELLQAEVAERTQTLSTTNAQLQRDRQEQQQQVAALAAELARTRAEAAATQQQLSGLQHQLEARQTQMMHNEAMASLGELIVGIAQEIDSPANFIHGNLDHAERYALELLHLVDLYQERYPQPDADLQAELTALDLDFIRVDLPELLTSLQTGTRRIREVIASLRRFAHPDVAEMQATDLHAGLESALLVLQSRLRGKPGQPGIHIDRQYGDLPPVICYAHQINQAIVNLLTNAIDALEETNGPRQIQIQTQLEANAWAIVRIRDNGPGIPRDVQPRLYEPFFTTKPVGRGTGLGLAICYQVVVERHQGRLTCHSTPGEGTEFAIAIPAQQPTRQPPI